MEILEKLFTIFEFLVDVPKYWSQFVGLAIKNPVVAVIVATPVVLVLSYIGITQLKALLQHFRKWSIAVTATVILLSTLGASGIVLSVNERARPAPELANPGRHVIGQRLMLSWSYPVSAGHPRVRYQVQSALDDRFTQGVAYERNLAQVDLMLIPRSLNSSRYWRVRAVDVSETESSLEPKIVPVSRWSNAVLVSQFDSALDRIRITGRVSLYTSNTFNEGIFAFGETGFDLELARLIVRALGARLETGRPLRMDITPVPWNELLSKPARGDADMIISSITRIPEREGRYGLKFSDPYFETTLALVHRADSPVSSVRRRLCDSHRGIGVQKQTTSEEVMKEVIAKACGRKRPPLVTFEHSIEPIRMMLNATPSIDVVVADRPLADAARALFGPNVDHKELLKSDAGSTISPDRQSEPYAVAVRAGEVELVSHINAIIRDLRSRGELTKLNDSMQERYRETMLQD